jgi:hypothetical protein
MPAPKGRATTVTFKRHRHICLLKMSNIDGGMTSMYVQTNPEPLVALHSSTITVS